MNGGILDEGLCGGVEGGWRCVGAAVVGVVGVVVVVVVVGAVV